MGNNVSNINLEYLRDIYDNAACLRVHSDKKIERDKNRFVQWAFFPFSLWINMGKSFHACMREFKATLYIPFYCQLNQFSSCFAFLVHSTSTFLCNPMSKESPDWFNIFSQSAKKTPKSGMKGPSYTTHDLQYLVTHRLFVPCKFEIVKNISLSIVEWTICSESVIYHSFFVIWYNSS